QLIESLCCIRIELKPQSPFIGNRLRAAVTFPPRLSCKAE
ncbi:hypothetical protein BVRB_042310, partial [Beta vulgaris subsp. vulgaris]